MLAVDFFHADCAVTLKRIYVFFALKSAAGTCTSSRRRAIRLEPGPPSRPRNLLVDLSINAECAYRLRKSGLIPACHNDRFSSVSFSRGG